MSVFMHAGWPLKSYLPATKHSVDAIHTLREIILMRHLGRHINFIALQESQQVLSESHFEHFLHQLLCGAIHR
eukprot:gene8654-11728_t